MDAHKRLCIVLVGLLVGYSAVAQREPQRPNILFMIADDWSFPHAGVYGDKSLSTPHFDSLSRLGFLATRAFTASPSCTPSRAAILTGQAVHRLREGANLWGTLSIEIPTYTSMLEKAGYVTGLFGKGWGPGDFTVGGYQRNPAGTTYKSFEEFLQKLPSGKPFCFWFGSSDPHRPYRRELIHNFPVDVSAIQVPPWFPDHDSVRLDLADYKAEVERFDDDLGKLLGLLQRYKLSENTVVVVTSDNGMPFPRAKANLYDAGTHLPLLLYWKGNIKPQVSDALISLTDLAPTFLEMGGVKSPPEMTGISLMNLLKGKVKTHRNEVFLERERHANVRKGDLSYPSRAIRTADFLYIVNYHPERYPAGDPVKYFSVGAYGDIDNGGTKMFMMENRRDFSNLFRLSFERRPMEELYDLKKDPDQLNNLSMLPEYQKTKKELAQRLKAWMANTGDPQAQGEGDIFSTYPYYGERVK